MKNITTHWSSFTLLFYILLGCIAAICCYYAKYREYRTGINRRLLQKEYFAWYFSWVVVAVWRYIDNSVGGTDAPTYINYFRNCLDYSISNDNMDFFFSIFTRAIRLLTDNYHVYFFVVYFFMIISFVQFINTFSTKHSSSVPLCILVLLYLRGFTSIRSNLSIAILLCSIVFLYKNKIAWSVVFAILACFTHKIAILYAGFIVFYYMYKKRNFGLLKTIVVLASVVTLGLGIRYLVINGYVHFLSSTYVSYARRSLSNSFLDSYLIISIPQIAIGLAIIYFNKSINNRVVECQSNQDLCEFEYEDKISFLRLLCMYDVFAVPITYFLGVYRGYEFFMIARLIMWGEIIVYIKERFTKRSIPIVLAFIWLIFELWMYGRIDATWESSHLMPYVFQFFS